MDDRTQKILTSIIFCLLFLTGVIAQAVEFEHISLAQKAELEKQFEIATSAAAQAKVIENRKWSCDMYGVRSRLQVQRGVKLYSLKRQESGDFVNSGAQVVSRYRNIGQALAGQTERLEDQIRISADGQLISRLSLRGPTQPNQVIAYSVCR